jgi:hypothetical protein
MDGEKRYTLGTKMMASIALDQQKYDEQGE